MMANTAIAQRQRRVQLVRVRPSGRPHRHHPIPLLGARPIARPLQHLITTIAPTTRVVAPLTRVILTGLHQPSPAHSLPTCSHRVPPAQLRLLPQAHVMPASPIGPPGRPLTPLNFPLRGSPRPRPALLQRLGMARVFIIPVPYHVTLGSQTRLLRPLPVPRIPIPSRRLTPASLRLHLRSNRPQTTIVTGIAPASPHPM
jgi:hypothetical protein